MAQISDCFKTNKDRGVGKDELGESYGYDCLAKDSENMKP